MENERDVADATLEGHGVRVCMSYGGTELYTLVHAHNYSYNSTILLVRVKKSLLLDTTELGGEQFENPHSKILLRTTVRTSK